MKIRPALLNGGARVRCVPVALLSLLAALGPVAAHGQGLSMPKPGVEWDGVRPLASFRLTFGLKDAKTAEWNGEVQPAPGQELQVEADRFRNHDYQIAGGYTAAVHYPDYPNDRVLDVHRWICSTRRASLFVMRGFEAPAPIIQQPTLFVHLRGGSLDEPIRVHTVHGDFAFTPAALTPGCATYYLDGAVRVDVVPRVTSVAEERLAQQDYASMCVAKSGRVWLAWQEFDGTADAIVVRSLADEHWSPPEVLAEKTEVMSTAVGEDAAGHVWVVWSRQENRNWDLCGRVFDGRQWSPVQVLTTDPGADAFPRLVTDSRGRLWLVWQRNTGGANQILAKFFDGRKWSAEECVSEGLAEGNNWWPAVAAGADGLLAVAWDGYAAGNYDVYLRRRQDEQWGAVERVAGTPRYEAQPSVAIDGRNRVWLAWNESGPNWGKDTGFLVVRSGTQLYESRSIRVACSDGGRWMTTAGTLPFVPNSEDFWQMPQIQIDAAGRPTLIVRHIVMRRPGTPARQPTNATLWEFYASRYAGDRWGDPAYLPRSNGRNDESAVLARAPDGGLWGAWVTDLRNLKGYQPHQHQVQLARFDATGPRSEPVLKPLELEPATDAPIHPHEAADVRRIRAYRIEHGGGTYAIYRGDLHRHTDISIDGGHDGSLVDAYRYARDAAALDFVGISNHTDCIDDPYNWWRSQKLADLFQHGSHFVAFYGYERSVEFPNGHRNVFFTDRGRLITEISPEPNGAWDEDCQRLYAYLHRANGFCISHTTGRSSGTDWRNYDPAIESVVEIYQGERDAYEYPDAPHPFRLWSDWMDPAKPIPIESSARISRTFREPGFVWNALAKGYKLGFIASSDHTSTHVGYACLIARDLTPEALVEAIRSRRTYAATDNLVVDARYVGAAGDEHLMGEIFASARPVRVRAKILGTGDLLQVDVVKDGRIVHTVKPGGADCDLDYTDADPKPGESYLYVRAIQKDGNMAWGSPAWVTYP
jgi:hypothetical protein